MNDTKRKFIDQAKKFSNYEGELGQSADRCKSCGGHYCCDNCSCSYAPFDFDQPITVEFVEKLLNSLKCMITIGWERTEEDKVVPFFVLKPREINAPSNGLLISVFSSPCAFLEKDGCKLNEDDRPTGGLLYVPKRSGVCRCSYIGDTSVQALWKEYSDVLEKVVEKRTGKNPIRLIIDTVKEELILLSEKDGELDRRETDILWNYDRFGITDALFSNQFDYLYQ